MATDSRFRQRSIASISFSFLIHISLLIGLVIAADSGIGTGLGKAVSDGFVAGAGGHEVIEIQFDELAASPQTEPPRIVAQPRPSRAQKRVEAAPITADESDIAIREALQVAREESDQIQDPLPVTDEPESLSPEIADIPDEFIPAYENQVSESMTASGASTGTGTSAETRTEANGAGRGNQLAIVNASQRRPLPGNPLPKYPERDRYLRHQGTTVLIGRVGADGRVTDVKIEKSSGSKTMDQEAFTAFRRWRFEPGPEVLVRKSFAFTLTGKEKVVPARLGRRSFTQE